MNLKVDPSPSESQMGPLGLANPLVQPVRAPEQKSTPCPAPAGAGFLTHGNYDMIRVCCWSHYVGHDLLHKNR